MSTDQIITLPISSNFNVAFSACIITGLYLYGFMSPLEVLNSAFKKTVYSKNSEITLKSLQLVITIYLSEGFFYRFPTIRREMSDTEYTGIYTLAKTERNSYITVA